VAVAVLIAAHGASAIQGAAPSAVRARKVVVPHVVAKELDVSIRKLRAARLRPVGTSLPQIWRGALDVNGYGAVSQRPRAGSLVPVGAPVLIRISVSVNGGPGGIAQHGSVTVPDVVGLNIQKAIRKVLLAGFTVTVPAVDHRLTEFAVRRQGLKPGRTVTAGTVITLVVAR
jgi:PASTA domain